MIRFPEFHSYNVFRVILRLNYLDLTLFIVKFFLMKNTPKNLLRYSPS